MTALTQYARLETSGRWRPGPGAEAQDVGVAFGDATLTVADAAGRPLSHWSLPAVLRLNPGEAPALYAPDDGGTETLEIDDDLMTQAIERVRASVARGRGGSWRAGGAVALVAVLAALAAGALWLPGALRREALAVVPEAKRAEIGTTLLGHLQAGAGAACHEPLGVDALERLRLRALGEEAPGRAVVLASGPAQGLAGPLVLPGGLVVLPRAVVEAAAEPAVVAGHILATTAAEGGRDPLAALLDTAGAWATLRLLATGEVADAALARHARALRDAAPAPADAATLGAAFAAAGIPLDPYAASLEPDAASPRPATSPAEAGDDARLLISDAEWVALQGICRE